MICCAAAHSAMATAVNFRSQSVFARVAVASALILFATPAMAQGASVPIPEPGDAALFVIAVVGLIIGRQASRRTPRRDDDNGDDNGDDNKA